MASIPVPARAPAHPNMRPLNVLRDLPQVADLIELCFSPYYDHDGEEYVRQMRRASRDESFLRWASSTMDATTVPLNGYIWEENGRIVGNTSLILFRHHGRKVYLLANVAVHPDYRHRGIARALTENTMQMARQRGASELWLHVRDDNPDALDLYSDLGFRERARRTVWLAAAETVASMPDQLTIIGRREGRIWPRQRAWLERSHPEELGWYRAWNWNMLSPGLWNWFYLLFIDMHLRQWSATRNGDLQAVLSYLPSGLRYEQLWLAAAEDAAPEAVTSLLVQARSEIGRRKLSLEHPASPLDESIRAAGFRPQRTLVWMCAEGATK